MPTKHGYYGTRTYRSWQEMKRRCQDPGRHDYHKYGGRGVTVCKRWQVFENFLADMGPCPVGLSLDRIKAHLNYIPSNCRWTDNITQQNNKRTSKRYSYRGQNLTATQWARAYGLPLAAIRRRLANGWSIADALNKPLKQQSR